MLNERDAVAARSDANAADPARCFMNNRPHGKLELVGPLDGVHNREAVAIRRPIRRHHVAFHLQWCPAVHGHSGEQTARDGHRAIRGQKRELPRRRYRYEPLTLKSQETRLRAEWIREKQLSGPLSQFAV